MAFSFIAAISPPDVQPDRIYEVTTKPYHGDTYLSMVVRDNDTWESVSQHMKKPMEAGICYTMEIFLARSMTYMSMSRATGAAANYNAPTRLRIWGGLSRCDKQQLLGETQVINHTEWKRYVFVLSPEKNYTHLILEACYVDEKAFPYNGNLLLDNMSNLTAMDCHTGKEGIGPSASPRPEILELETTVAVTPISKIELAEIVATSAPRIAFNKFGSIERSLYVDRQTNEEKSGNLPLYSIVEALSQHPLASLTIVITEKDADLAEKKKQSLKTMLSQMRARSEQVIVRNWQESDANKTWDGNPESGVLLRLIL